ncbi:peptidoglycan DD-metalloendopeptidase family protein [Deinococcus sp.]|uniref:murein hydrolase activator EnvC family protein n=1 Tax=Deinococcus sp. TaxID=47478 RepID=UPI003CC5ED2B
MRRRVRLAGLLLTGLLALPPTVRAQTVPDPNAPASSIASDLKLPTTSARLQQLQQQLDLQQQASAAQKAQLQTLRKNIDALSSQQKAALARIDQLSASVADLETKKRQLDLQIQLAQQQIGDLNLQIQGTEARVARLQQDVRQLLVALYRERSGRYLQLLSQSASLSDLLIRARYANMSGQNNVRVVQALQTETARLQSERQVQAAQATKLQTLQAQQIRQLQALSAQRQEQSTLVARLRQNQAGQQTLALQTQAQQALTSQGIQSIVGGILQERGNIEAERQRRIEAERQRRAAELARIRAAQEAARREQERLAALKAEQERQARIAAEQARLAAQQARVAAQRAQQRAAQLRQQQLALRQQQLAREAQQATQARQNQLKREQEALAARQQAIDAQNAQDQVQVAPLPSSVGDIVFPLPGGRVSAPFDTSGGPWTVISGSDGAQAVAVAEGNVITAANYANLGWVVIIDHGPLISTSFGLSQPLVSVGQRVSRGQAIGVVGGSPQFGPQSMALQLNQASTKQAVRPPF